MKKEGNVLKTLNRRTVDDRILLGLRMTGKLKKESSLFVWIGVKDFRCQRKCVAPPTSCTSPKYLDYSRLFLVREVVPPRSFVRCPFRPQNCGQLSVWWVISFFPTSREDGNLLYTTLLNWSIHTYVVYIRVEKKVDIVSKKLLLDYRVNKEDEPIGRKPVKSC